MSFFIAGLSLETEKPNEDVGRNRREIVVRQIKFFDFLRIRVEMMGDGDFQKIKFITARNGSRKPPLLTRNKSPVSRACAGQKHQNRRQKSEPIRRYLSGFAFPSFIRVHQSLFDGTFDVE